MRHDSRSHTVALMAFITLALETVGAENAADYFPLVPGAEWRYAASVDGFPTTTTARRSVLESGKTMHGTTAYGVVNELDGAISHVSWLSVDEGIRMHREDYDLSPSPAAVYLEPPLKYASETVEAGTTHAFGGAFAYVDSGDPAPASFPNGYQGTTQVIGFESVTTPAGTFDCLKLRIREEWYEFGFLFDQYEYAWWLAEGVGLVKSLDEGSGLTLELESHNFGGGSAPAIEQQPRSQTATEGADVEFIVIASGDGPLTYQWRKNQQDLTGQTTGTLVLTSLTKADQGSYTVVVGNGHGSKISEPATLTVQSADPDPGVTLGFAGPPRPHPGKLELSLNTVAAKTYEIETCTDLTAGVWTVARKMTAAAAVTTVLLENLSSDPQRFFRFKSTEAGVNPEVNLPVPGQEYPAGTTLGGEVFGVAFTIPPEWRGGLRVGTPLLVFYSDTAPGFVFGAMGFAWTRDEILNDPELASGFEVEVGDDNKVFFQPTSPIAAVGEQRISAQYAGLGGDGFTYALRLEIVAHPSGGFIGFLGLTTQEAMPQQAPHVVAFAERVKTTPRPTNADYGSRLPGRSFKWDSDGHEWSSGSWTSSASAASWGDNYAFFCDDGTFEINRESTSYITSNTSTGWGSDFMSLSYGSTTKEYGQWTVVNYPQYGDLLLLVTLSGYDVLPIRLNADDTLLAGEHKLKFHEFFNCPE